MLLSYLSALLVISTHCLLCLAAGNKGKKAVDYDSTSYSNDEQSHTLEHHSEDESEHVQFTQTERELFAFGNKYMMDNNMIHQKLSKTEWVSFQAENPKVFNELRKTFNDRKKISKTLSILRAKFRKDPKDPQVLMNLQKLGYDSSELHRGKNKNISLEERARIKRFVKKFRQEVAEVKNDPTIQRSQPSTIKQDSQNPASILPELQRFRNAFLINPFDPQLQPMLNHINNLLISVSTRRFVPLTLIEAPANQDYFDTTQELNRRVRDRIAMEFPSHASHPWLHQNSIQQQPYSPERSNHEESNYGQQHYYGNQMGQEYTDLDSQMDDMHLNTPPELINKIQNMESPQRHDFVKKMFYSDDESEEE